MLSTIFAIAFAGAPLADSIFVDGFDERSPPAFTAQTVSFIGGSIADRVSGAGFSAAGEPLLAGTFELAALPSVLLLDADANSPGMLVVLRSDGLVVDRIVRLADEVNDLAIGADGRVAVALRQGGVAVLNAALDTVLFADDTVDGGRVDLADDGSLLALTGNLQANGVTPNSGGSVRLYLPNGHETVTLNAHRKTYDVAISRDGQRLFTTGFNQTNGPSGNPVQIAYLRAYDRNGAVQWTNYDWSGTQVDDPNQGGTGRTNNMADTRGVRVAIGNDGDVYTAFMAAGGNHIFRYQPDDLFASASLVGGDAHHEFFNTASEHKLVFARYSQTDGAYLRGQQLVNRLNSGRGNTITLDRGGDIRADRFGRPIFGGIAASGTPLTNDPLPADSYTGGAFFYIGSPDFAERLFVSRYTPSGKVYAVAIDERDPTQTRVLFAGETDAQLQPLNALQTLFGGGEADGWFGLFTIE